MQQKKIQSNYQHLSNRLKAIFTAQKQNIRNVLYMFGDTGEGKSTLVNCLLGNSFQVKKKGGQFHLHPNGQGPRIGNQCKSQTEDPSFYKFGNFHLGDFPGLKDTKGVVQDLVNSVATHLCFQKGKKVKFFLVVSLNSILSSRGGPFVEFLQRFVDIFSNDIENIAYSTAIIVSKVDSDTQKKDVIQAIKEIMEYNQQVSHEIREFLEAIIERQRVETFKNPLLTGFNSENIQTIKNIAKELTPTNLSQNSNVSLSSSGLQFLRKGFSHEKKTLCEGSDLITGLINRKYGKIEKQKQMSEAVAMLNILQHYLSDVTNIQLSCFQYIIEMLGVSRSISYQKRIKYFEKPLDIMKTFASVEATLKLKTDQILESLKLTIKSYIRSFKNQIQRNKDKRFNEARIMQMKMVEEHQRWQNQNKIKQLKKNLDFQGFVLEAAMGRERQTGSYQLAAMRREQQRKMDQLRKYIRSLQQ